MRIVQTFWTAGRDPLAHSFGWLRPEYNLMAWALSCLCLRKYYDEVALYTDEQGKHVLIDMLGLPYTEVHVCYDETLCLPQHWAYAKIKTYSMQTKPFLHIDNDIFLTRPIAKEIAGAPLVAQSREKGTAYYRQMIDRLLEESDLELPDYVIEGVKEESIVSYNMGLFGGSDLEFINVYCEEALALCDKNKSMCTNGNFNLLFEQMFFALKARKEGRQVSTVFPKVFADNGYMVEEFCQLNRYSEKSYFHLLGGHKRNPAVTEALAETLLLLHPVYYKKVVFLFPYQYPRGIVKGSISLLMMNSDIPIRQYIDFLSATEAEWSTLTWDDLLEVEQRRIKGKNLSYREDDMSDAIVCCNPYMKCYDVPASWGEEAVGIMRKRLSQKEDAPMERVAVIPTLTSGQRKEYAMFELEHKVLEQVNGHPMPVQELVDELTAQSYSEEMRSLWQTEIRILLNEGLLVPENN